MLKRFIFILSMLPFIALAQSKSESGSSYKAAAGLRAGYHPGATLKYMISSDKALEGILQFRYRGISATGLFEKHAIAFDEPQLRWFYGVGGHLGYYARSNYAFKKRGYYYYDQRPSIGIDGILGLEYVIQEIPFSVSADFKPYIDIFYPGFGWWDGAISVRYIF